MFTLTTPRRGARLPWVTPFEPNGENFENRLRRFFDGAFMSSETLGVMPAVEVSETPQEYTCVIELPGLQQKDVEIGFENGALSIKGEKRDERESAPADKRYHVWERTYGAFQRSFTFPARVDEAKIAAVMNNGVLTVTLPKTAEEKAKSRKIEIEVK
jgi:HSP20 family protein